jgi:initiation factor 1A
MQKQRLEKIDFLFKKRENNFTLLILFSITIIKKNNIKKKTIKKNLTTKRMTKNTTGGNRQKSKARKNVNASATPTTQLRTAKEEGEMYGQVLQMNGGNVCSIQTLDGKNLLCIIPRNFVKNKRDNFIKKGVWVLVGSREWESTKKKCDLLEVYNDTEKEKLKKTIKHNWDLFSKFESDNKFMNEEDDKLIHFSNEEPQPLLIPSQRLPSIQETNLMEEEPSDEIDFDDI